MSGPDRSALVPPGDRRGLKCDGRARRDRQFEWRFRTLNTIRSGFRYLLYPIFTAGIFFSGLLPADWGYRLGSWGGDIAYRLMGQRRRITAENIAVAMGLRPCDQRVMDTVRQSLRNYGKYLYETSLFSHLSTQEILDRVSLFGEQNMLEALAHNRGVIFVSAHFGNMDLAAVYLANRVAPMTVAGTPLEPRKVMAKLTSQRAAKGLHMTVYDGAPRDVLTALRRKETVGFAADLGVNWNGNSTVLVDFFGKKAPFPAGLAKLALHTGAPIVPGYGLVKPDHSVEAHTLPPIYVERTGDKQADITRIMQSVAHALEGFLKRNPEQWYMFRPMWASSGDAAPVSLGQMAVTEPAATC